VTYGVFEYYKIKDEVIREFFMKKFLIMDKVQVVINELLLDCPIVTLDVRADLRAEEYGTVLFIDKRDYI